MSSPLRSTLVAISILSFMTACGPTAVGIEPDEAVSLSAALQADEQAYAEFSRVPVTAVLKHYHSLTTSQQASLWRVELERAVDSGSLTAEQQTFLRSVKARLPLILAGQGKAFAAEASAALGDATAREVFGHLAQLREGLPSDPNSKVMADCNTASCTAQQGGYVFGSRGRECFNRSCSGSCGTTDWGCGLMFLYDCTSSASYSFYDCRTGAE